MATGERAPNAQHLGELLVHARATVPFYNERVADGAALGDFPIVTRQDVSAHFADLIARDAAFEIPSDRLWIFRTSGSTGRPISHIRDLEFEALWDGIVLSRVLLDAGAPRRGDLFDLGLNAPSESPVADVVRLPPFQFRWWTFTGPRSERKRDEALAIGTRVQPSVIIGMPSRIAAFGELFVARGIHFRPAVVLTSFEQLTDAMRAHLAATFGCEVTAYYSTAEMGPVAWECPAGRYHFDSQVAHVEILDLDDAPVAPGATGRLVATSLKSWIMPVIRYDTGDLARRPESDVCACGKHAPSIAGLEGRAAVVLHTPSGRELVPYRMLQLVDALGVAEYQVVQRDRSGVEIVLPTDCGVDEVRASDVERRIAEWVAEPFVVCIRPTGQFLLTISGKRNPMVSLMPARSNRASSTGHATTSR